MNTSVEQEHERIANAIAAGLKPVFQCLVGNNNTFDVIAIAVSDMGIDLARITRSATASPIAQLMARHAGLPYGTMQYDPTFHLPVAVRFGVVPDHVDYKLAPDFQRFENAWRSGALPELLSVSVAAEVGVMRLGHPLNSPTRDDFELAL